MENKNNEKQSNRDASEKLARNDEQQAREFRKNQNELIQSEDPETDRASLLNKQSKNDSLPVNEQNIQKLKSEQDEDFGSEQL